MDGTRESVSFDAQIEGKNWRIVVERELVEDELERTDVRTDDLEEFVEENSLWLTNLAMQKIEQRRLTGDTVTLTTFDRGR